MRIERVAVVCHPHPLHGGSMHNKVVFRLARAARRGGAAVIRFQFRGVGLSDGSYDEGRGEQDDVRAALRYASDHYPGLPLVSAGFSFGSRVGLRVCCADAGVDRFLAVGTPVDHGDWSFLGRCGCPKFFLHSTRDQYGSRETMESVFERAAAPKQLSWIESPDHFFHDALDALEEAACEAFQASFLFRTKKSLNLTAPTRFILLVGGRDAMRERHMTTGRVAAQTGVSAQAGRHYEREGLLPAPNRTHTGYRLYGTEVVGRLNFIRQARALGLSLGEIREIFRLSEAGSAPCCRVRELLSEKLDDLDRRIAELTGFRSELQGFLRKLANVPDQSDASSHVCRLIEIAPPSPSAPEAEGKRGKASTQWIRCADETAARSQGKGGFRQGHGGGNSGTAHAGRASKPPGHLAFGEVQHRALRQGCGGYRAT